MSMNDFTLKTIRIIEYIPAGRVLTYGLIAELAGSPRSARQVARTLHSLSEKYNLPWHRVVNSKGQIALNSLEAKEHQKLLLEQEGVTVSESYSVDLDQYLCEIDSYDFDDFPGLEQD